MPPVEIHDPAVAAAVAQRLGHGPPFGDDELARVRVLTVYYARDVAALAALRGLATLSLVGCEVPDLEPLRALPALRRLDVRYSAVRDVGALAECAALATVELHCDCVEDASPLLALPALEEVDLAGNPLREESFRRDLPALRARGAAFAASEELEWELTRALHARGLRASYYRAPDAYRLCAPGLAFTDAPEAAHPAIPPDALRRELERPDLTLTHLFATYPVVPGTAGPPPPAAPAPPPFDLAAHETVGGADDARAWVRGSALDAREKAALLRFIDRFPDQRYFRVDDAWLDHVAAKRGVDLPRWLRETRKVLSYVRMPGVYFKLCFDRVAGEAPDGTDACYWANIRGPTVDEMRGVVRGARLYPLGDGGPGMQYTLAVALDETDRRVYRYRAEDGGSAHFTRDAARVAFESYAEMFDRVTALLLPDGTRIEARR